MSRFTSASNTLTFTTPPERPTLGRNGYSQAHGLAVTVLPDEVYLEPINSRGVVGRARLVLPRQQLGDFIALLKQTDLDATI